MSAPRTAIATFGCGCFWTKQHLFGQLHGVVATRVGFMGGWTMSPSYREVCQKTTGHAEVVEVTYDRDATRFSHLLKAFFCFHDAARDRTDKGGQYRSVVFYRKAKERILTERAIELLRCAGLDVTTQVKPAQLFWEAAPRHQGYVARTGHRLELAPPDGLADLSLRQAAVTRPAPTPSAAAA